MNAKTTPAKQPGAVKMWHPEGDCQIGLTSGHTIVVSGLPTGTEIPRMFRREAIARGCIPVGMSPEDLDDEKSKGFDRNAHIKGVMRKMLESTDDADAFDPDGKPNLVKVSALAGFTVERHERDSLWEELENDLDGPPSGSTGGAPAAPKGRTVKAETTTKDGAK
jgi:hypothetical protein